MQEFVPTNGLTLPVLNAPGSVGTVEIADDSVTSGKIQDGTIQLGDIGRNGATAGQVMKWNGAAWVVGQDLTGGTANDLNCTACVSSAEVDFNFAASNTKGGTATNADLLDGWDSSAFAAAVHLHDDRYFTELELATSGAGGAVHWNNLTGVPGGFADGVHNDTTYTAGPGLVLNGNQFSLASADLSFTPSQNSVAALDSADFVGYYTSVTIGSDGLGLISYYDLTNGDLKVAHCANALCVPFFRRR